MYSLILENGSRRGSESGVWQGNATNIVLEVDPPITPVSEGAFVYRGLRDDEELRLAHAGLLAPPQPLGVETELIPMLEGGKPFNHVLSIGKRIHFLSWSMSWTPAAYYATSGRTRQGWVAFARLPLRMSMLLAGMNRPVVCTGNDGTGWFDPRHHIFIEHPDDGNGDPFAARAPRLRDALRSPATEWIRFKNRARVDDELLLAHGRVRPHRVVRVQPREVDPSFAPWEKSGEALGWG